MRNEPTIGIPPSQSAERVFLETGGVKVTSARFVVPGQTFAMSGVTSVKHWRTPRRWVIGALALIIGLPMLIPGIHLASSGASNGPLAIGGVLALLGALAIWRGRPQSQVRLQSSSGETKAFASYNDALVRRIVEALTESIIFRG